MNYHFIPEELRKLTRWVCVEKGSKLPFQPFPGLTASVANPHTWSGFNAAVGAVEDNFYSGIGFVFHDDGIVGIDIDDGFDEDGEMTKKAEDIIYSVNSYTELSRSGRGFHILVKGDIPFNGRNNRDGVEIYKTGRYFITTGEVVMPYIFLKQNQKGIDHVLETYFANEVREAMTEKARGQRIYTPVWERPSDKIPLKPSYPPIPEGCRNISLMSVAGALRNVGMSPAEILDELRRANAEACTPPLDDNEIRAILNSSLRYRRTL